MHTYYNKDKFLLGESINTSLTGGNFKVELEEGEEQGLATAHKYAIQVLTEAGYNVIEI